MSHAKVVPTEIHASRQLGVNKRHAYGTVEFYHPCCGLWLAEISSSGKTVIRIVAEI